MIADRIPDITAAIAARTAVECQDCRKRAFWTRTQDGRSLLLDFEPHRAGDIVIEFSAQDVRRSNVIALYSKRWSAFDDPDGLEQRFVPHQRTCTAPRGGR